MPDVAAQALIKAPSSTIWAILTDADRLVAGGLGVLRIDGQIRPGARLKLWSEVSPNRAFALRVSVFEPPRQMAWTGGMPLGLFRGTRRFSLTTEGEQTMLRIVEEFTGPLAPMITRTLPDLQPSFDRFVAGIKHIAEGGRS